MTTDSSSITPAEQAEVPASAPLPASAPHEPAAAAAVAAPGKVLEAESIINKDMLLAMGVGVVPIPVVDFLGVTAVQLRMLRRLTELYQTPYSKRDGSALVSALVGGALPAAAALPVASLVRWIPVVGWTLGSASMAILSGASTYAVGKVFVQHFEKGGTIDTFDAGAAKDEFLAFLHIGKQKAASLKKAAPAADVPAATEKAA